MNQDSIGNTKFICQDKFANGDPVFAAGAMPPNGQPVWFVAVCVSAGEFFASPGNENAIYWSR